MGKRTRRQGLTNATLRRARSQSAQQDKEAHELAQAVYIAAREARAEGGGPALAPIIVSAEIAAPRVAERLEIEATEQSLGDVAAFLVTAWLNGLVGCTRADFDAWRTRMAEKEAVADG